MIFYQANASISNSDNCSFLNELGGVSFEEGVGRSSFISHYCPNKCSEAIDRFRFLSFDDFNENVVAVPSINQTADFNKVRFGEFGHKVEKLIYD